MRLFFAFLSVILVVMSVCPVLGVGIPAGTTIELVAHGTYSDLLDQARTAVPATARLTVAQVAAVAIDYDPSPKQGLPGRDAYVPLRIINLGNGNDAFNLLATSPQNWDACFVYDDNADGVHQEWEQSVINIAGLMVADGYTACFARVSVPSDASSDETVNVAAESMFDPAGASASAELKFTIPDGPAVQIISPTAEPNYQTTSTTVSLGGLAFCGLPIASVTWSSSRGPSGTCTGTESWTASDIPLKLGLNVITVTVTDTSGRTASDSLNVTFTDVDPPTVTITSPTTEPTYSTQNGTITISGTASDNVAVTSVNWSNDRGGSGACTGTATWTAANVPLQGGVNVITITAKDASNNSGTDVLRVTCITDTTPPTVTITIPTDAPTYTTDQAALTIGGTASDDIGVVSVSWSNNTGGSGTCNGTTTWTATGIALTLGQNVITVTARDQSGKTGTDTITVTYTGGGPPTVQITSPTSDPSYSTAASTLNIAGTASHNSGITSVSWTTSRGRSGVCVGTTSWAASAIPLLPGQNVIVVTATSGTGTTGTDTLTVTRVSPEVVITGPTTNPTYTTDSTPLTVTGTASDDVEVKRVTWSNDRGGSGTCSGTTSWTAANIPLLSGQNVITVTAFDADGNTGQDVLSVTYTPDTTPPDVQITGPTSDPSCARNCPVAVVTGTATDSGGVAAVNWRNDATAAEGTCTVTGTSWSTGEISLALGDNHIVITARDTAGNTSYAAVTIDYVDSQPRDAWTGLAMVSLPIIPDNTDPKVTVGFAGNNWCAFVTTSNAYAVYPDAKTWLEPAASTPGRGFWAYFDAPSSPYGTIPAQNQPAVIRLHPGWNIIGTPFVSAVTWDVSAIKVRELGGEARPLGDMGSVAAGYLWGWRQDPADPDTGTYYVVYDAALAPGIDNQMEPWRGYWIKAYRECDLILPPPQQ